MSDTLQQEIIDLAQRLVRIPSPDGCATFDPVIEAVGEWLDRNGLPWERLVDEEDRGVGVFLTMDSGLPGLSTCLDAPIDTATVSHEKEWQFNPFDGVIDEGRMHGRGAADCKIAVSIFCHLARELAACSLVRQGRLHVLFDADEHSGRFGGIRSVVEQHKIPLDFVAIGYPGNDAVCYGARGFYRVTITCFGNEGHSGGKRPQGQNPLTKAAQIAVGLSAIQLPAESDPDFAFGPRLSVTQIKGGDSFSTIPATAELKVDVRLTPGFTASDARRLIKQVVDDVDADMPGKAASEMSEVESRPAYKLDADCQPACILLDSARAEFGPKMGFKVCGPGNIGNYLAQQEIPSVCGFGVSFTNAHGKDESIDLSTISGVYRAYLNAVRRWHE